jgi:putative transposase
LRYAFIVDHVHLWAVTTMCRVLEVSKAGYYAWRGRKVSARARADTKLRVKIRLIHQLSKTRYGCPRIHAELQDSGVLIGRTRVARLMRLEGIRGKKRSRSRATTNSSHSYPIAGNVLARQFNPPKPNRAWAGDITYFATKEGWLYLAIIIDLCSRRIVGWSMSNRIDSELVLAAAHMAIKARRPGAGLLVHTDRGSQYACREYRDFVARHGIIASMSRKGDCWDNAVAESFFSSLKVEIRPEQVWATRSEARSAIFEYIEAWYNRERRHSALRYLSPVRFEARRHVA